ncbi:MAG: hypothetical protein Q8P18_04645 [Pseudomonadota bacterium]|nr:hypothetical protein [Pseudomonadota bacterium]
MRIRKLAKDLETDEVALMAMLRGLGHVRYTDPEQQLPGPIEAQLRRHARDLPKVAPPVQLPAARPRPAAEAEPDLALFERAMATVRPIGPQPKAPPRAARAAPPSIPRPPPPPAVEPQRGKVPEIGAPRRVPVSTLPAGASVRPPPAANVGVPVASRAPDPVERAVAAEARLAEELGRVKALEARLAEAEARNEAILAREAHLLAHAETLASSLAEVDGHRRQLQRDAGSIAEPPATAPLGACFERRGLLGEDEIASALRALLDGHRAAELLRIQVAEPDRLEELLWERILLLAEDDPTPPGVVAVRVPAERSEGRQSSANRTAMSRFSTACLVHNVKCIVIVGGSPAYHRTLRDGLDPRLDVRLIPGNRRGRVPSVPTADLVILWASTILDHSVSAQFPQGIVVPHRSVARMLGSATEWIESR